MAHNDEPTKWAQRDRKIRKRAKGMRVTGTSIFVIRATRAKRDERLLTGKNDLS